MVIKQLQKLIELGVSKASIAKGVGVGASAIGRWADGTASPSDENLLKLKRYIAQFQVAVAEL